MAAACVHIGLRTTATDLINIGTGVDITIRELADQIAGIVGYTGPIDYDPTKPDGTPQKLLDASRLAGLGWRARIDLVAGLRETYAWYQGDQGRKTPTTCSKKSHRWHRHRARLPLQAHRLRQAHRHRDRQMVGKDTVQHFDPFDHNGRRH